MSVSSGLLGIAAPLAGGFGSYQLVLHKLYSSDCIKAVADKSQLAIYLYCPPGFKDFNLIVIIAIAVAGIIAALFWKDILQAIWEKIK